MISSKPFNLLKDLENLKILIRGLTNLPFKKRGLYINFTWVNSLGQAPEYQQLLYLKIPGKQIEESCTQRLIKPASVETANAVYALAKEKCSYGLVEIESNTPDNCKFLKA